MSWTEEQIQEAYEAAGIWDAVKKHIEGNGWVHADKVLPLTVLESPNDFEWHTNNITLWRVKALH